MKAPAARARRASSGPVSVSPGAAKSSGSPTATMCQAWPASVRGACNSAPISVVNPSDRNSRVSVIGNPYSGRKWSVIATKSYPASR
jgi:hypothetical protein